MEDQKLIFTRFLQGKGLRLTTPRQLILDEVFAVHQHFNAEELYARVKQISREVSLATVYRTLPLLLEAGLIQKAVRSCGRDRYEHILGHPKHVHWLCRDCGAIIETDMQAVLGAINAQAQAIRFKPEDISLNISGICWKCAANESETQNNER